MAAPTNIIDINTGFFTDYAAAKIADWWHRGTGIPPITNRYLGLSTLPASRAGTVAEPSGSGYARVVLPTATTFESANRGMAPTLAALTFTPTADWPAPIVSCFLVDLVTIGAGNVIWTANLIIARTVTLAGGPVAFAAGALIVVR